MSDQNCKNLKFQCIVGIKELEDIEQWLNEFIPCYMVQEFDILSPRTARVIVSFDNCSDAVLFKLRWC